VAPSSPTMPWQCVAIHCHTRPWHALPYITIPCRGHALPYTAIQGRGHISAPPLPSLAQSYLARLSSRSRAYPRAPILALACLPSRARAPTLARTRAHDLWDHPMIPRITFVSVRIH